MAPVYRAFRLDQEAWLVDAGLGNGRYELDLIELQLSRAAVPPS